MSSECPNMVITRNLANQEREKIFFNYTSYCSVPFQIESPYSYNWCRSRYSTAWSNRSGPLTIIFEHEQKNYQTQSILTSKA